MAQLQNCKSDNCGRGVLRDSVTDQDGHAHPRVRVACATCGVGGEWQVDDSLTRAIVDWNERYLPNANKIHDDRAAEARERELVARAQRRSQIDQQIEHLRAEAAHARLKESDVRKSGDKESGDTFAKLRAHYEANVAALEAQLKELDAA